MKRGFILGVILVFLLIFIPSVFACDADSSAYCQPTAGCCDNVGAIKWVDFCRGEEAIEAYFDSRVKTMCFPLGAGTIFFNNDVSKYVQHDFTSAVFNGYGWSAYEATVERGREYVVTPRTWIDGGFASGITDWVQPTKIYVDWNNDFDFDDAGELVAEDNLVVPNGAHPSWGSMNGFHFTVPMDAVSGAHVMRILTSHTSHAAPTACSAGYDWEDFSICVPEIPCDSQTCIELGKECGSWDDGCGTTLDCGGCGAGETCTSGTCEFNLAECANDELIMKLDNINNAHGALWNQDSADYPFKICSPNGEIVDHLLNTQLWLDEPFNAHAEYGIGHTYPNEVSFGNNLVCEKIDSGSCDIANGYSCVVTFEFESDTNAHLATCDVPYDKKICCKTAIAPGSVYWSNMQGLIEITGAQLGDSVKMVWKDTGLAAGTELSFEIWEDDVAFDDAIRTGGEAIRVNINFNGDLTAIWTITQDDLDKTSDLGEFYFKIFEGSSERQRSEHLDIASVEENSKPIVRIVSPSSEARFGKNIGIDFKLELIDEDDDLEVTWNFEGVDEVVANCLTGTDCDKSHIYISSGTKIIFVSAKEMGRQNYNEAKDNTNIFVFGGGRNLFADISEPGNGLFFEDPTVHFNAKDSFVSECISENEGDCSDIVPSTQPVGGTSITLGDCRHITTKENVGDINTIEYNCFDYPKDWIGLENGYNLWYDWIFSDGGTMLGKWDITKGDGGDYVDFTKLFLDPGENFASLRVGFERL